MTVSAEGDREPAAETAASEYRRPRLLPGTELLGRFAGSGLREPPYLVRRRDGQVVQLSRLLYEIASQMDGRDVAEIAERAGRRLDLRITPEQVAYVAERKLAPLGVVTYRDGSAAHLGRVDALLALRFRAGVLPGRAVNALAGLLRPLFLPPLVIAALAALAAFDVWLASSHSLGADLRTVIHRPALGLALIGSVILSLIFYECGHASACRYGGARPGGVGIGIYLVWPVFYTDVTDSYRLSKAGRLRTDLGGVYFNVLFALAAAGGYAATSYTPLILVVVSQQLLILDQFVPWVRLDGYYIVSDLIGVPDLFTRIKPVLKSALPGRHPEPRVAELRPAARAAVTTWVITTVAVLAAVALIVTYNAPDYLQRAWQSLIVQADAAARGARIGSVVEVLSGAIGAVMLLLPVAGITLNLLLLCRRIGGSLTLRRARIDATTAGGSEKQPPSRSRPVPRAVRPTPRRLDLSLATIPYDRAWSYHPPSSDPCRQPRFEHRATRLWTGVSTESSAAALARAIEPARSERATVASSRTRREPRLSFGDLPSRERPPQQARRDARVPSASNTHRHG
jgi:putative peptide zinc metalloprotease protein